METNTPDVSLTCFEDEILACDLVVVKKWILLFSDVLSVIFNGKTRF